MIELRHETDQNPEVVWIAPEHVSRIERRRNGRVRIEMVDGKSYTLTEESTPAALSLTGYIHARLTVRGPW